MGLSIDTALGYSDPYDEGGKAFLTFSAPSQKGGTVNVHADAFMLTNIVNGEIGNLAGKMGAFYLAGVGRTLDYYIVNKNNVFADDGIVHLGQGRENREAPGAERENSYPVPTHP